MTVHDRTRLIDRLKSLYFTPEREFFSFFYPIFYSKMGNFLAYFPVEKVLFFINLALKIKKIRVYNDFFTLNKSNILLLIVKIPTSDGGILLFFTKLQGSMSRIIPMCDIVKRKKA